MQVIMKRGVYHTKVVQAWGHHFVVPHFVNYLSIGREVEGGDRMVVGHTQSDKSYLEYNQTHETYFSFNDVTYICDIEIVDKNLTPENSLVAVYDTTSSFVEECV